MINAKTRSWSSSFNYSCSEDIAEVTIVLNCSTIAIQQSRKQRRGIREEMRETNRCRGRRSIYRTSSCTGSLSALPWGDRPHSRDSSGGHPSSPAEAGSDSPPLLKTLPSGGVWAQLSYNHHSFPPHPSLHSSLSLSFVLPVGNFASIFVQCQMWRQICLTLNTIYMRFT